MAKINTKQRMYSLELTQKELEYLHDLVENEWEVLTDEQTRDEIVEPLLEKILAEGEFKPSRHWEERNEKADNDEEEDEDGYPDDWEEDEEYE